jgi:hypothetical protein
VLGSSQVSRVSWDYSVLAAVNGFGQGVVVMSWALAKWAMQLCWLEHRKGQAAVVVGKEVGQGKMDGGPRAGEKRREPAGLVWKFGPWPT